MLMTVTAVQMRNMEMFKWKWKQSVEDLIIKISIFSMYSSLRTTYYKFLLITGKTQALYRIVYLPVALFNLRTPGIRK